MSTGRTDRDIRSGWTILLYDDCGNGFVIGLRSKHWDNVDSLWMTSLGSQNVVRFFDGRSSESASPSMPPDVVVLREATSHLLYVEL